MGLFVTLEELGPVFAQRTKRLEDMGFTFSTTREYNFVLEGVWSCFWEQVRNFTDQEFEEYVNDIQEAISRKDAKSIETDNNQ